MKNELIRVALYIRVSTDRQAKEGDSLEAQENALVEYAKNNNMIIADKYIDGGESGQKISRTNLQRLLQDVRQNKIDLIIITKLDRWFRSVADFYKVQETLNKHKVKWKTIWEDYDMSTASGEFWLNMSLSLAKMEAKRTGERIDSVFDYKYKVQKTVCTGNMPYGYKVSADKKIIIDEEKAEHIRRLYNHYIETNNILGTVRWFRENCSEKCCSSIRLYLKDSIYIGKFVRKRTKEIVDDYAPPILDVDTFNEVQRLLKKNIKNYETKRKHPYIFSGLLVCGQCGFKMTGRYSMKDNRHYYQCKKAIYSNSCTNRYNMPALKIERFLEQNLLKEIDKQIIDVKKIDVEQKEKDNTPLIKSKLNKLAELYVSNMIDIDYYKTEYEKLNKQLQEEENKKVVITDYSKLKQFAKIDIFKTYNSLDNVDKRRLLCSVINHIVVKDKEHFEIFFNI